MLGTAIDIDLGDLSAGAKKKKRGGLGGATMFLGLRSGGVVRERRGD